MAFNFLLSLLSVLLAAWTPFAAAQDGESDVKTIPLRTHSLQQVSGVVVFRGAATQIDIFASLTSTLTCSHDGSTSAATL
jgi:hypothetical protein